MDNVHLIASPDDYLLEEKYKQVLAKVCSDLGSVEPEVMPEGLSPELLAVELCSPSLFAPQRVLVISEARPWLDVTGPKNRRPPRGAGQAEEDPLAVVQVLGEGLSDDVVLILQALCVAKPSGSLVDMIEETGRFHWQPVPAEPKPWEEAVVSDGQAEVLRGVISRVAGSVRFEPAAERLLFERLGFAPRLLVQEVTKLAAAASDGMVDVKLVRRLSFPKEGSLERALDGLYDRRAAPILQVLSAAKDGLPVRDLQGQLMDEKAVPFALFGRASTVFQQLLYLRVLGEREGFLSETDPRKTSQDYWYPRRFKSGIGPKLEKVLEEDSPSPLLPKGGKKISIFALSYLFRAAGLYSNEVLENAVASLGTVESAMRSDGAGEALSVWFSEILN